MGTNPMETAGLKCGPLILSFPPECLKEKPGHKLKAKDGRECSAYRLEAEKCLKEKCSENIARFPMLLSSTASFALLKRDIDQEMAKPSLKSALSDKEVKLFYSALNDLISAAVDECGPILSNSIVEVLNRAARREEILLKAVRFVSRNKINKLANMKDATCSNEPAALLLVWVYKGSVPGMSLEQLAQNALKFFPNFSKN